ncbi:MAG: hypothetical protein ACK4LQ_13440 [Pararhodobacter sp.]
MKITLSPQLRADALELDRAGDVLAVNGVAFDFADLAEGEARAVDCPWIVGPVLREGGAVHLTLILPHDENASEETRFPSTLTLLNDGPVALPSGLADG